MVHSERVFCFVAPRLNLNWLMAFLQIANIQLKRRTELVIYTVTFVLTGCLFVFLLTVTILRTQVHFSGFDLILFIPRVYSISYITVGALIMLLLLLLVALSVAGLLVVRRIGGRPEQLNALRKLIAVAVVLVVTQAFKFSLTVMNQKVLYTDASVFVPEWYSGVLVQIVAEGLQIAVLLYVVLTASMKQRSLYAHATGDADSPSTELSSLDIPLLKEKIPKQYEI